MTEQSYAILDTNNIVVNLVALDLDANPDWAPGDGLTLHTTPGEGAIGQTWDGSKFNDPVPLPPTGDDVDAERDRRRYLQISVTTSPTGTFPIDMDATSQLNIQGLVTAGLYLANAAPSQVTVFRDANNTNHNLLPSELIAMGLGVQAYIGNLYAKSWALKAMSPIPADFAADSYWT